MTTRSQKRKAVEELVSTEMETPIPETNQNLNPVAGTSKSPRVLAENLEEIKSSLRKEIMSDLTKILAENQKEMLKLIAPPVKKQTVITATEETDSESENIPENATSTPIKNKTTATNRKITPVNSRNMVTGVLNDSTNLGKKKTRPLSKIRFPRSKKQVQKYIGFINYYRNYIPRLSEKMIGMFELLKADAKITISEELVDNFKAINASLAEACGLALRQPVAGKQYVLMTDASFRASGYALMIEENDDKKLLSKRKTFAPVAFGSCVFSPSQLKMSIYCKEFLAIYHAFLEYSHILWETTLPTLVLTDNRSVTRFFQTKTTPPALWNACDYVLQFKFRIMHVAGSQNTAADFLSRLELTPKEKVQLKLRDDIITAPIEVNLQSTDVADEEQLFSYQMKKKNQNRKHLQEKLLANNEQWTKKNNKTYPPK